MSKELTDFKFFAFILYVTREEAFPGSPAFEFDVRRATTTLRINSLNVTHHVRCPVTRLSDLERVVFAIDAFLSAESLTRLCSSLRASKAICVLFEKYLRETRKRLPITRFKFAHATPAQSSFGRLILGCPYFSCFVYFDSDSASGFINNTRIAVPNAFLPFYLAGQDIELVTYGSKSIRRVFKRKKNAVRVFAVCRWDELRFLIEVGVVSRELLTFASDIARGFFKLSACLEG